MVLPERYRSANRLLIPPVALMTALFDAGFGRAAAAQECAAVVSAPWREEWRYMPPETSPPDRLIGEATWVSRHPSTGSTYVLDAMGRSVVILDATGGFVTRVGKGGQGPGEFSRPTMIRGTRDGFAVYDRNGRISYFNPTGVFQRQVTLDRKPSQQRDFQLLSDGQIAITGIVPLSEHVLHLYGSDGKYRTGLGRIRTDLKEPILQNRYSDGVVAETADGSLVFARRVPLEFSVFSGSREVVHAARPDVIHDYVREVAVSPPEGGWRFGWRHPSLTSLLPLSEDCFLLAIQRLPEKVDGKLPDIEDYFTEFVTLNRRGEVQARRVKESFFWPTNAWRDQAGVLHLLGIGLDRETGGRFPVQYGLTP